MAPRPVDIEIRANGVDGVRRNLRLVKDDVDDVHEKAGRGARGIAGALLEVAHAGDVGVGSMKAFAKEGAELVTFFGTAGPVVGAIALIGLAFYEAFDRSRKEMERTRYKALQELQAIAEGGDLIAASKAATKLYSGDPYAAISGRQRDSEGKFTESEAEYQARLLGVTGIQREVAAKQHLIDVNKTMIEQLRGDSRLSAEEASKSIDNLIAKNQEYAKWIHDVGAQLDAVNERHQAAIAIVNELAKKEGERTQNVLNNQNYNAAPDEVPVLSRLGQYEATFGIEHQQGQFGVRGFGEFRKEDLDTEKIIKQLPQHIHAAKLFPTIREELQNEFNTEVNIPLNKALTEGLANTLGGAIGDGIGAAFQHHSIAEGFKAGGVALLGGLGGIFEQMGAVWIKYGILHTALGAALWNPITSGPAAIGIGLALEALGATLGALAHQSQGGYGSSSSSYGSDSAFGAQRSIAGNGQTTVIVNGRYVQWDLNDPAQRAAFADFVRSLGSTGEIIFSDAA
jgi:hypothetical protein